MTDASDFETRLRTFVDRVLHVQATYINVFGNAVPGMSGGSAGSGGSRNAQADFMLQRNTLAFAKAVSEHDTAEAQRLSKEVEGGLMMVVTLGALTQKEAEPLLDELVALTPKQ